MKEHLSSGKFNPFSARNPIFETGRRRCRGARSETPSSVSCWGLPEFRGASSVSSFLPIICGFLAELTEFAAELSEFSL